MSLASDRRAVGLYTVLARDACDFLDMVKEEQDVDALTTLYLMLATPNPKAIPENEIQLNALGASLLKRNLEHRGIPIPDIELPVSPPLDPPVQGNLFE